MLVTFGREATTRAARTGARAAGCRPSAALRRPGRGPRRRPTRCSRCSPTRADAEVAPAAGPARPARSPSSTPPPSPPPTSSASRCWPGSAWPADADPDAVFVESVDDLLTEVVDDFYVRKYGDHGAGPPAFEPGRGAGAGPARRVRRAGPAGAGRRGARQHAPTRGTGSPRPCGPRSSGASGSGGSTPTTTCSPGSTTRCADPARGAAAPAAGPLPGGAGRRVPGHRPGAVVDPAPRLPRPHARWC